MYESGRVQEVSGAACGDRSGYVYIWLCCLWRRLMMVIMLVLCLVVMLLRWCWCWWWWSSSAAAWFQRYRLVISVVSCRVVSCRGMSCYFTYCICIYVYIISSHDAMMCRHGARHDLSGAPISTAEGEIHHLATHGSGQVHSMLGLWVQQKPTARFGGWVQQKPTARFGGGAGRTHTPTSRKWCWTHIRHVDYIIGSFLYLLLENMPQGDWNGGADSSGGRLCACIHIHDENSIGRNTRIRSGRTHT